jgi:hypothetical protein
MALKVAQNITTLSVSTGISTSVPIELTTGYLRLTPTVLCNIETGGAPVATSNTLAIPAGTSEIIKERVARQKITGITTGTSTIVSFGQNSGNPFVVGDYVTIGNSVGIDTTHTLITAKSENPFTGESTITISYNSSSLTGIAVTNAYAARSIKVAGIGSASGSLYITEVQIASQA